MDRFADFGGARWIWTADNRTPDQKVVFRRTFSLSDVPPRADAVVSCETKFWLWLNGAQIVFEGGVFRESLPGCGYAEQIDLAPWLRAGENTVAVLAWFYGNGGRNNTNSGEAGFILAAPSVGLFTDARWRAFRHPAYVPTGEPRPSHLYGGHNVGFCAPLDVGDFTAADFDDSACPAAAEYENRVWGQSLLSPLPLLRVSPPLPLTPERTPYGAAARLPYAMTGCFGFVLDAAGGEIVDLRTDRYRVNGGPGDGKSYNGHRIEYTAKPGRNEYFCPMYLYGESVELRFPPSVTLRALSVSESGYDTRRIGAWRSDDALLDRLIEKSVRTLYVCMRNNFMDCPDRERGQWIGDVSVQAPQIFAVFDERAHRLLRKSIHDFIHLRQGDVLRGNVPGQNASELPGQSLVALSDFGLIGEYWRGTLDRETLAMTLEPAVRYLRLWETDADGALRPRAGRWRWFDHLYNVDDVVLEHGLYLAAAKFTRHAAGILGRHEFDGFLRERIESIGAQMERFWKGSYYASGGWADDRANAIAVLCGACPAERYPAVRQVLLSVQNATPYMERFVLKALCEMGYAADAYRRMMSRYYNLAVNENTTLWEDFTILGTRNHAWSGAPLEIAFRYLLGARSEDGWESCTFAPVPGIFRRIECTVPLRRAALTVRFEEKNGVMTETERRFG